MIVPKQQMNKVPLQKAAFCTHESHPSTRKTVAASMNCASGLSRSHQLAESFQPWNPVPSPWHGGVTPRAARATVTPAVTATPVSQVVTSEAQARCPSENRPEPNTAAEAAVTVVFCAGRRGHGDLS